MQPEQLRRTITSQFATSPTLLQIIENLNTVIDPNTNFQQFYDQLWNIDTAVGVGLDVWGRRVGIGRVLEVVEENWFGFAEAGDALPFNDGTFYTGLPITSNYALADLMFRRLILAKAALNITNCSYQAINWVLMDVLFPGRGNAWVSDVTSETGQAWFGFEEAGDALPFNDGIFFSSAGALGPGAMNLTYHFSFPLTAVEVAIVVNSGVLPKPVGVVAHWDYVQAP